MSISLCMIVKDEERCIIRCLDSVKEVVNEIIVVDTGSTDKTLSLIQEFQENHPKLKIKVFDYEWQDDFSEARNFSLSKATGQYILVLDADEYLCTNDVFKFKNTMKYLNSKKNDSYRLYFNLVDVGSNKGTPKVKLFPNGLDIYYSRPIHENLSDCFLEKRFKRMKEHISDIRIFHDGYDPAISDINSKLIRNLKILGDLVEKDCNDMISFFYFARDYYYLDAVKGLELLQKAHKELKKLDKPYFHFYLMECESILNNLSKVN